MWLHAPEASNVWASPQLPWTCTSRANRSLRSATSFSTSRTGSVLLQVKIEKDLVDEYRILTSPVVLGVGKRLFGTGAVPRILKLVRSGITSNGVLFTVYRPAGSLKTGSFALEAAAAAR